MKMLDAGAIAVEIYSAFVYNGWGAARRIAAELSGLLDVENRVTITDAAVTSAERS